MRYKTLVSHVESHASAVSLLESGEQRSKINKIKIKEINNKPKQKSHTKSKNLTNQKQQTNNQTNKIKQINNKQTNKQTNKQKQNKKTQKKKRPTSMQVLHAAPQCEASLVHRARTSCEVCRWQSRLDRACRGTETLLSVWLPLCPALTSLFSGALRGFFRCSTPLQ